jgi:acetate kinase
MKSGCNKSTDEIKLLGRVVHGGSAFSNTVIITSEVKIKLDSFWFGTFQSCKFRRNRRDFSSAKQVAFWYGFSPNDSCGHKYAVPNPLTENKIRVYGFHGTSHKYVSENAIHYLEQNSKNKGSKSLPYI